MTGVSPSVTNSRDNLCGEGDWLKTDRHGEAAGHRLDVGDIPTGSDVTSEPHDHQPPLAAKLPHGVVLTPANLITTFPQTSKFQLQGGSQ